MNDDVYVDMKCSNGCIVLSSSEYYRDRFLLYLYVVLSHELSIFSSTVHTIYNSNTTTIHKAIHLNTGNSINKVILQNKLNGF